MQCGLPVHATEHMLPYLRRQLTDGGWLPATLEGLRGAQSARIFDPRQRPKLSNDLDLYVTKEPAKGVVQRVFSDDVKCLLSRRESGVGTAVYHLSPVIWT